MNARFASFGAIAALAVGCTTASGQLDETLAGLDGTTTTSGASVSTTGSGGSATTASSTGSQGGAATTTATSTSSTASGQGAGAPVVVDEHRVVLAGDSWSSGLIGPLRDSLDDAGFDAIDLTYDTTARAGSQAQGWVNNNHPPAVGGGVDTSAPRMLDALHASLDADPPATVLVLVIGGNDVNREADAGLGTWPGAFADMRMQGIQDDVATLVDEAIATRPHLRVALVGYDFFHYEFLVNFGLSLDGFDTQSYNETFVDLGLRKRAVADGRAQVQYVHNFGLLQHVYGDTTHPPFSIPNPLIGFPTYDAQVAPAPGNGPSFDPFPGGFVSYPAPLAVMPDGIHPSAQGFRTIADNIVGEAVSGWLTAPPGS